MTKDMLNDLTNKMNVFNSPFFMHGILPKVCIHSIDEDEYSDFYDPRKKCICGCDVWINSTMEILKNNYRLIKNVQRCELCNDVRLSDRMEKHE